MEVIEYLKLNGLNALQSNYNIKVKKYEEDGLMVLNYDQILSPKNILADECRGLILDLNYELVSRAFDRFYNYGERNKDSLKSKFQVYEKIDGSLIKIYFHKKWNISTRGTAFAECKIGSYKLTFEDLVLKALDLNKEEFQICCNDNLDKNVTYIFEVTAMENRIVTIYEGYKLWFLSARDKFGNYLDQERLDKLYHRKLFSKVYFPKKYGFSSIEECIQTSLNLKDLEEGYVIYENSIPIYKIKSPSYVAIHHLRGEGLCPKKIAELILINETDEYLKYFPEDEHHFILYKKILEESLYNAQQIYNKAFIEANSQKEFANIVKKNYWSHFAFGAYKVKEQDLTLHFNKETNLKKKIDFLIRMVNSSQSNQPEINQPEIISEVQEKEISSATNEKPKLTLYIGISGSGKSREAQKYQNVVEINRDKLRFLLFCNGIENWEKYKFTKLNENIITKKCIEIWKQAVLENKNVIVSDTNLKTKYNNEWRQRATDAGYSFEEKYFPITLEEAFERDLRRGGKSVGRELLIHQYKLWLQITKQKIYIPNNNLPKALICDVDGTIAEINGRSHYDFNKVLTDIPREEIISMIKSWSIANKLHIIFMSGRDECCREDTIKWIQKYFYKDNEQNITIFMRKHKDKRNDKIIKEELFWEFVSEYWNIISAIDDRPRIVRLWHDIGIPNVISVQKGYNEF